MHPTSDELYGLPASRPEDYDPLCLDAVRRRWDQKADRWDADLADEHFHLNEDGAYERFMEVAEAEITRRSEFCRRHTLVDLGCGTGLVLDRFSGRFSAATGVDISPRMLAAAARRKLPRTRLIAENCFDLAAHVAEAGAVLSRGILLSHYGPRWAPVLLDQVRQVLVPDGGFALLDFLNAEARDQYACNPENKSYYRADEMESLGRAAGFRAVSVLGEPKRRVLTLLAGR